jgi:hypothetical protein
MAIGVADPTPQFNKGIAPTSSHSTRYLSATAEIEHFHRPLETELCDAEVSTGAPELLYQHYLLSPLIQHDDPRD